jgi:hypothetical protein
MSRYDRPSHRVYMTFFVRQGWQVQFLEADCRTPLPRKYTFTAPEKIRDIAQRGQATSGVLDDMERDIQNGRVVATWILHRSSMRR